MGKKTGKRGPDPMPAFKRKNATVLVRMTAKERARLVKKAGKKKTLSQIVRELLGLG